MKKKLLFSLVGMLAVAFFAFAIEVSGDANDFAAWYNIKADPGYTVVAGDLEEAQAWQAVWKGKTAGIVDIDSNWGPDGEWLLDAVNETSKSIDEITTGVNEIVSKAQLEKDAANGWDVIKPVMTFTLGSTIAPAEYVIVKSAKAKYDELNKPAKSAVWEKVVALATVEDPDYDELHITKKMLALSGYVDVAKVVVAKLASDINGLVSPYNESKVTSARTDLEAWKNYLPELDQNYATLDTKLKAAEKGLKFEQDAESMKDSFDAIETEAGKTPADKIKFPTTYAKVETPEGLFADLMNFYAKYVVLNETTEGQAAIKASFATVIPATFDLYVSLAKNMYEAMEYLTAPYVSPYASVASNNVATKEASLKAVTDNAVAATNLYDLKKIQKQLTETTYSNCKGYITSILTEANLGKFADAAEVAYRNTQNAANIAALEDEFVEKYTPYVIIDGGTAKYQKQSKDVDYTTEDAYTLLAGYVNDIAGYYVEGETPTTKVGTEGYAFTYAPIQVIPEDAEEGYVDPYKVAITPTDKAKLDAGKEIQKWCNTTVKYPDALSTALSVATRSELARKIADAYDTYAGKKYTSNITFANSATRKAQLDNLVGQLVKLNSYEELTWLSKCEWAPSTNVANWKWNKASLTVLAGTAVNDYGEKIVKEASKLINAAYPNLANLKKVADWMVTYAYVAAEDEELSLYHEVVKQTEEDGIVSSDLLGTIETALADADLLAFVEENASGSYLKNVKTAINKLQSVLEDVIADKIPADHVSYFSYVYGSAEEEVIVYKDGDAIYGTPACKAAIPTSWKAAQNARMNRKTVDAFGEHVTETVNAYIYINTDGYFTKAEADAAKAQPNVIFVPEANYASHIDLNYTMPYHFKTDVKAAEIALSRTNPVMSKYVCFYVPFDLTAEDLEGLNVYYVSGAKVDGSAVSFGLTEKKGNDNVLHANKPYMVNTNVEDGVNEIKLAAQDGITIKATTTTPAPVETSIAGGKVIYKMLSSNKMVLAKDYTEGGVDYTRYFWQAGKITHYKASKANKDAYVKPSTLVIDMNVNSAVDYVIGGFYMDGEEDVTGIQNVTAENAAVEGVYTISGQKVNSMAKPGLYIVNGKKVMVK